MIQAEFNKIQDLANKRGAQSRVRKLYKPAVIISDNMQPKVTVHSRPVSPDATEAMSIDAALSRSSYDRAFSPVIWDSSQQRPQTGGVPQKQQNR